MGLHVGAAVLLVSTATPAIAGVLPFDGAFGDSAGCALYSAGTIPTGQGEFYLLTPNTFASYPVQCDFLSAASGGPSVLAAQTVCRTATGETAKDSMRLIDHGAAGYGIKVEGIDELGPFPACPPKQPGVPTAVMPK